MSSDGSQPSARLSHAEYFALERAEDQRYEYLAGEVFAMTGGSESHSLIAANLLVALAIGLRQRPCRAYGSDMKVRIEKADKFCYSDALVVCDHATRHPQHVDAPSLVAEVLSTSTESYDRGLKFEHYRRLPSLRYYLVANQDRPHLELFERDRDDEWRFREANGLDSTIHLDHWDMSLALAEVYRNVDFAPESD